MKPFNVLLMGAAIWGVTLALAFIGGIAIGSSGDGNSPELAASAQPAAFDAPQGQLDPAAREELRRRIQSGEATQEEIDQLRQRFQQGGGGGGQRGQFGGPGAGGQRGDRPGTGQDSTDSGTGTATN